MTTLLEFGTELAHQAGRLALTYFNNIDLKTSLKQDRSVVTEADLAVDRFITDTIHSRFPDHRILSEELNTSLTYPSEDAARPSSDLWIIDPLDGTTNFSLGLPIWGVIITLIKNGWPSLAAIYFPCLEEIYTAELNRGAYLNGSRIQVQPPDQERPLPVFACCARAFRRYDISIPYKARILGSAAYSFCLVSRGSALVAFESTPKIWDIAGPWLMVKEAAGEIGIISGDEPFPIEPELAFGSHAFPTLAAATPEIFTQSAQQIKPKLKLNQPPRIESGEE